jgi:hypothetical protein
MGTEEDEDEDEEEELFPELGKDRTPGAIAPRRKRVEDHIVGEKKKKE